MSTDPLAFNPSDPAYVANPYPTLARLRKEAPVYWWEQGHTWLVSRYDDVEAMFKDPRFSTKMQDWNLYRGAEGMPAKVVEMNENGLVQVSPADHARIRKLVMPSFTPRATQKREALILQVVDELLEGVDDTQVFDLVQSFAEELPVRVISRILGIPPEHDLTFREWAHVLVELTIPVTSHEERVALAQQAPAGYDLVERVIEQRRTTPTDDLLSSLIHTQEEGERLSLVELQSLVGGLITAGSETTVHLVAFSVLELLRHPETLARVKADLSLIPGAVEEVLRHDNFGKLGSLPRFPLEDLEIRGQRIRKGEMVMCMINAAMHDEDKWSNPEVFDIDRDPTPNISFGRGPHFCLGAHLARAEVRVALRILLSRFPGMQMLEEPTFAPHPFIRRMKSLLVRLQPEAAT